MYALTFNFFMFNKNTRKGKQMKAQQPIISLMNPNENINSFYHTDTKLLISKSPSPEYL